MSEMDYIKLRDVPPMLPRMRDGKLVSVSTVYRWTLRGIGRVVLQTVQIGHMRCTTKDWLREFFVGISLLRREAASSQDSSRSRHRQAEAILDRAGIRADRVTNQRRDKNSPKQKGL